MKTFISAVLCVFLALLASQALAADSTYHVINTFKLGGDGGWDYLTIDSSSRRMFISRATHVMVIDADSGKILGDIPDTPGVHGIALANDLGKGFISNGREGTVTIFDLDTLKATSKVKAEDNPDAILYDPATKRVFAFNGRSSSVTAIDAVKGAVVGTIKLEGKPEFAATDGKGMIFVNIEDKSQIDAIDPAKLEVKSRWPLAPCDEPSGLAIDVKNRRLFAGCDNKLMAVINADTGKVVTTVPIGEGVDANAFDPDNGLAYASTGDGHMTIARQDSPDKYTVLANVETQQGARTMALDAKTHNAYTVTAKFGPPPAPTADNPHPRRSILPDTFVVIVVGK